MFCSSHIWVTERRVYSNVGTQRTLVSGNLMSVPSVDLAMIGMSPIIEHLVTWPLADEKISSQGRVLISLLQSFVLLAVQPESGMAEKAEAVKVSV